MCLLFSHQQESQAFNQQSSDLGCYREGNTPNKDDIPKCPGAKSLDFNYYQEASIICVDHVRGKLYLDFMDVVSIWLEEYIKVRFNEVVNVKEGITHSSRDYQYAILILKGVFEWLDEV